MFKNYLRYLFFYFLFNGMNLCQASAVEKRFEELGIYPGKDMEKNILEAMDISENIWGEVLHQNNYNYFSLNLLHAVSLKVCGMLHGSPYFKKYQKTDEGYLVDGEFHVHRRGMKIPAGKLSWEQPVVCFYMKATSLLSKELEAKGQCSDGPGCVITDGWELSRDGQWSLNATKLDEFSN